MYNHWQFIKTQDIFIDVVLTNTKRKNDKTNNDRKKKIQNELKNKFATIKKKEKLLQNESKRKRTIVRESFDVNFVKTIKLRFWVLYLQTYI